MTLPIISIIIATLAAIIQITRLHKRQVKYRKLWIQTAQELIETRAERDEWQETARRQLDQIVSEVRAVPKLKREITLLHEENDRLKEQVERQEVSGRVTQ